MLISPEYLALNRQLHERDDDFGVFAGKYGPRLLTELNERGIVELLDYGAGKGVIRPTFAAVAQHIVVHEYDPAVEGKDYRDPCEAVCSIAMMEHVEPSCLDAVLDDIRALAKRMGYFVICTRASGGHILPDGRNPHLIVHDADWWLAHLRKRWNVVKTEDVGKKNFVAVCEWMP